MSTVLDTPSISVEPPVTSPVEPSTVESSGKKRTRSALRSLTLNDGSPEKRDRPPRKVSRAVAPDKENVPAEEDSLESL